MQREQRLNGQDGIQKITGKRVGVISLGCDKNRVDTEKMLAVLKERHNIVSDIERAEIIIINTCAFLCSAREESIGETLTAYSYKQKGCAEKIIVTGCLPQKFIEELWTELKEADAFLGVADYDKINSVIDRLYTGERVNAVGEIRREKEIKRVTTTDNYAYLKIADGCNNHCTYCLIPKIRGEYRSIPKEQLLKEARELGNIKELILVAQDTSKYGQDLKEPTTLTQLIRELSALSNIGGIRLLYCYPEGITEELINEYKCNAKMIRYIDMPLQHASDKILKKMNRKGSKVEYLALIERLKREIPGIAIRSTFIAGFPGESEEDFNELVVFLSQAKIFNAGFFAYSREEGTPAYNMEGQISERAKKTRVKKLYATQKKVVKENLSALKGRVFKVCAEGFDNERLVYFGRPYFFAPEIDGKVYFFSEKEIKNGEYYDVKILKADGYDLIGKRIENTCTTF